ncbi:hypothetical protein [Burkholderia thailandensis]|uniref:hypothetical protein n=1 Tax=Burkholderia thailandensis TaxID=57975 RepID=UPI0012E7C914|nr:hypothetical protein [Burkholderia thailandensis]MCS3396911.1 hypothetical protein [Burkholderia thailandensis]MUV27194.1 hypothetical protein [Burkholderia thailandensis]QIO10877.1 hypothetical protein G9462_02015 [Burkholderia thailandensis]
MTSDEKIAHLGFIQGAINRMAGNVFLVKGWSVALAAAMTALTSDSKFGSYIAVVPMLLFWWLDAYYVRQEKLFRELFGMVSAGGTPAAQFSMDTSIVQNRVASAFRTMGARTVYPFYLLIFCVLLISALKGYWIDDSTKDKTTPSGVVSRETYIVLLPNSSLPGILNNSKSIFHLPDDQNFNAAK